MRSPSGYTAKYPACARRRQRPEARNHARDFSRVLLGYDTAGAAVCLDETVRLEHGLFVGATGTGKTTLYKSLALQDFRRGRGGIVIDPHGSHPGSLYHELIAELHADGFFASGRVHLLDCNAGGHVVPINFLAPLPGTDAAVIADALLAAVERVWGDEDTQQKPTIRTVLKATFTALCELHLPLADAKLLYDAHDRAGLRARVISQLENEYARDEIERLHQTTTDERSKRDFRAEVVGPINRLNEFVSSEALRAMLGVVDDGTRRTLDLLRIMDQGEILLVNLAHGPALSEANSRLLGALLLRYVFLLAGRRSNREPFMLFVDEAARYLSGDVPSLLAEARKYGIAGHFALQFMAQAGNPDDLLYQALLNSTAVKAVFAVRSPEEAQRLAPFAMPLDLERPVQASVRPTVVGHRRVSLVSRSTSLNVAESEGEAESEGHMVGVTHMHSRGSAIGTFAAETSATADFSALGDSSGTMLTPQATLFGPNAASASMLPVPLGQSVGTSASSGSSRQSGSSSGTSEVLIESEGEAVTVARSRATGVSRARSRGRGETQGTAEAFEPVYADLPSAWHSKDNELYRAGELLRALPVGRAYVSFRGRCALITIPAPKRQS